MALELSGHWDGKERGQAYAGGLEELCKGVGCERVPTMT